MRIKHKDTGDVYSDFPAFVGSFSVHPLIARSGYLVVSEGRVLFFYAEISAEPVTVEFSDVTNQFTFDND